MHKISNILILVIVTCISFAKRDPFSFESSHDNTALQENLASQVCQKSPVKKKKSRTFNAGDKFDDNWTIKSVKGDVLILENEKGQICQVSLGTSTEKK